MTNKRDGEITVPLLAPRGGNDPLGSIPLFYAEALEAPCGDTGL